MLEQKYNSYLLLAILALLGYAIFRLDRLEKSLLSVEQYTRDYARYNPGRPQYRKNN